VWLDARSQATLKKSYELLQSTVSPDNPDSAWKFFDEHCGLIVLDDMSDDQSLIDSTDWLWLLLETSPWAFLATSQNSSVVGSSGFERGIQVDLFEPVTACSLLTFGLIPRGQGWSNTQQHVITEGMDVCFGTAEDSRTAVMDSVCEALRTYYGITSYSQLVELSEALGYLPLAIVQRSAYMKQYGIGAAQSLEKLRSLSRELRLDLYRHAHTGRDVLGSFEVSIQRLDASNPAAAQLLTLFSFLDRNSVSQEFLEGALSDVMFWDKTESSKLDPDLRVVFPYLDQSLPDYHKSLGWLQSLCLVTRDLEKLVVTIHSQVHESIHLRMSRESVASWLQQVIRLLLHRLPPLLYSCKDSDAPRAQEHVLRHADRLRDMVLLYERDLQEVHTDVACFFLECYLWHCGESFLACGEKLKASVPRQDRDWVGNLFAGARLLQEVERFQRCFGTPDFDLTSISESTRRIGSAQVPSNTRHSITNAALFHRLSGMVQRQDRIAQRSPTDSGVDQMLFSAYDGLSVRDTLLRGMDVAGAQSKSSIIRPMSRQERVSTAVFVQEAADATLARFDSKTRTGSAVFAPRRCTLYFHDPSAKIIEHLDAFCDAAEEGLRVGVAELRPYFSVAISVMHAQCRQDRFYACRNSAQSGDVTGNALHTAHKLLAAAVRSNRSSIHKLARASWPPKEAYQSILSPFPARRDVDDSVSTTLNLLLNEPLIVAETHSKGYDIPPRNWFHGPKSEKEWLKHMLDSIDSFPWKDDGQARGLRRAALEYGRRLGMILPSSHIRTFFCARMSACTQAQLGHIWSPGHEADWADVYYAQLESYEDNNTKEMFQLLERVVAEWAAFYTRTRQRGEASSTRAQALETLVELGTTYFHHIQKHTQEEAIKKHQLHALFNCVEEPLLAANGGTWPVNRRWLALFQDFLDAFKEEDARRAEEEVKRIQALRDHDELEIDLETLTVDSWTVDSAMAIHSYSGLSREIHRPGGSVSDEDLAGLGFSRADLSAVAEHGINALQSSDSSKVQRVGVPIGRLLADERLVVQCQV
jgi:hypothetical protein